MYLRDGQSKNLMSLKLQHAELTSLRTQVQGNGEAGGLHMGTDVHIVRAVSVEGAEQPVHGRIKQVQRQRNVQLSSCYVCMMEMWQVQPPLHKGSSSVKIFGVL